MGDAPAKGKCRWCWEDLKEKGRRTWCSDACVKEYNGFANPSYYRGEVERRDNGVCQLCRLDIKALQEKCWPTLPSLYDLNWHHGYGTDEQGLAAAATARANISELAKRVDAFEAAILERGRIFVEHPWMKGRQHQHCWEIDHIVPVIEGGGGGAHGGIANLRLLCIPCHRAETKALAGRRARQPKKTILYKGAHSAN